MCKEMPVIWVNRVVNKKRILGKLEGQGGGEEQGVAELPPPHHHQKNIESWIGISF
jgi:hypothetical protein